jgi:arsenate reductase (glutaredoxin)
MSPQDASMKVRIYHNPRCSKSRAALGLLEAQDVELEVVPYLDDPPSRGTLRALLGKLDVPAMDLVRTEEPEFRALGNAVPTTDEAVLDLLVAVPRLLQRPIVETHAAARIGRPPERVLELLE